MVEDPERDVESFREEVATGRFKRGSIRRIISLIRRIAHLEMELSELKAEKDSEVSGEVEGEEGPPDSDADAEGGNSRVGSASEGEVGSEGEPENEHVKKACEKVPVRSSLLAW